MDLVTRPTKKAKMFDGAEIGDNQPMLVKYEKDGFAVVELVDILGTIRYQYKLQRLKAKLKNCSP